VLATLSGAELLYSAAVLAVAFFVQGLAGFGSGLIAIPLLVFVLPLQFAVPLSLALTYVTAVSHGLRSQRHVRWREMLPLMPFSMAGVVLGLIILKTASVAAMSHALGTFVVLFAVYQFMGVEFAGRYSKGWAVLAGGSGGVIGTVFGTGGPFYVIYFRLRGLDKTEMRATIAATFLVDGGWRLVGFGAAGYYTRDFLIAMVAALPVMVAAFYVGSRTHMRMSQQSFQRAISVLLAISGLALLT